MSSISGDEVAIDSNWWGGIETVGPVTSHQGPPNRAITATPAATDIAAGGAKEEWQAFLECSAAIPVSRLLYYTILKRLMDLTMASVMLALVAPILIVSALAIRVD